MTSFYYLTTVMVMMLAIGSIFWVLKNWYYPATSRHTRKQKDEDTDIGEIFKKRINFTRKNKNIVLIKLAQAGIVSIKEREDGGYSIVKHKVPEDDNAASVIAGLFEGNVEYVSAEDAIMSVESVRWSEAKYRFYDAIDAIRQDIKCEKGNKDVRAAKSMKKSNASHIDYAIIINWCAASVPLAFSYAVEKNVSLPFSWFVMMGIVWFILIMYMGAMCAFTGISKECRKLINIYEESIPGFAFFMKLGTGIIYLVFGGLLFVVIGFSYSLLSVQEWVGSGPNLSYGLALIMIVSTVILVALEFIRKKQNGYETLELPYYADKPGWYEGEHYRGIKELVKELDK